MTHCPGAVKRFRAARPTCGGARHLVGNVRRKGPITNHLNLGDRTADQTTSASTQRMPSTLSPLLLRCGQQMPSTGQLSFSGQSVCRPFLKRTRREQCDCWGAIFSLSAGTGGSSERIVLE